ncbi:RNA-binding (RRM/RBD/RNP motifs) family protein [Wolffia australiana]
MAGSLDMSLDDIIKKNKKPGDGSFRGRGGGRGSGPGPARRIPNRTAVRGSPYSVGNPVQAPSSAWQRDVFSDSTVARPVPEAARVTALETGTKLYISNLDFGVSNDDIKELFSEVGDLKRYTIHYDRSGRSKGTAEVVFTRRADALTAIKRYNNVQLDGKPMKIDIVGTNLATPVVPIPQIPIAFNGNSNGILRSAPPRVGPPGWSRGGGGRGRGRGGRRPGRGSSAPVSAADLDAELDKYHTEAMQTN